MCSSVHVLCSNRLPLAEDRPNAGVAFASVSLPVPLLPLDPLAAACPAPPFPLLQPSCPILSLMIAYSHAWLSEGRTEACSVFPPPVPSRWKGVMDSAYQRGSPSSMAPSHCSTLLGCALSRGTASASQDIFSRGTHDSPLGDAIYRG